VLPRLLLLKQDINICHVGLFGVGRTFRQNPGENASQKKKKNIIGFFSRLYIEIVLIQTKDYTDFLSSVICVNNFLPLKYG
jgi:hypothetical protein